MHCPALLFQWNHNAHAVTDPGPHVHGKELPCSSPQHILGHSQACFSQILLLSRERLVFDAGGPALQAPSSGSGKVSLPCAHLVSGKTTHFITAHTKHTSLIGSNHSAVNIDNNPEFKASLLDGTQRILQDLKLCHSQGSALTTACKRLLQQNHFLVPAETQTQVHTCEDGFGWIFHCKFLLQHIKLTYAQEKIK